MSETTAAAKTPLWWRVDAAVITHRPWETLIMRAALAALVWFETDWVLTEAYQGTPPNPEGLAHLPGAAFFAQPMVGGAMMWLSLAGLLLYALGRLPVLTLLPTLFGNVMIGSIKNSQGAINHSDQLLSMVLLTAWLVYLWAAIRRRPPQFSETAGPATSACWNPGHHWQLLSIHWIKITVAAAYVVSALQKWIDSDLQWIWRAPWLAVQIIKNNRAEYYSKLELTDSWLTTGLPQMILDHPNLARVVFGSGLLLETFAFLALISRRWSFALGLALIGLHLSISVIMNLNFEIHMWLIGIFLVNLPGVMFMWKSKADHTPLAECSLWQKA